MTRSTLIGIAAFVAVLGIALTAEAGRRCKTCRRKDICPVPLEEPGA